MNPLKKFILTELELRKGSSQGETLVTYDPDKKMWKVQSGLSFRRGNVNQIIGWMRERGLNAATYKSPTGTLQVDIKKLGQLGARMEQSAADKPKIASAQPRARSNSITIEDMDDHYAAFKVGSDQQFMRSPDKSPESLEKLTSHLKKLGYSDIKVPGQQSDTELDIQV